MGKRKAGMSAKRHMEAARREAIISEYLGGASAREVAKRYGIKEGTLRTYLHRWGISLPPEERRRRLAHAGHITAPLRTAWPDCPPHLQADYRKLSLYMPRRQARAELEAIEARRAAA